jgi:hypothetical protein
MSLGLVLPVSTESWVGLTSAAIVSWDMSGVSTMTEFGQGFGSSTFSLSEAERNWREFIGLCKTNANFGAGSTWKEFPLCQHWIAATRPMVRHETLKLMLLVVPRASPKSGEHSEFQVTTAHAEPLRKSTHVLHQYTSPFTMLPSVLFYKEGLYIFTQHSSKHWCGSPFTSSPHHHLVRVGVNTSILILIVSILLYFLQASLIAYAIWQFELK